MERASLIIKKLQQLLDDNASADVMLAIAQMLVAELQELQSSDPLGRNIAVTVPKKSLVVEEVAPKEEAFVAIEPIVEGEIPAIVAEEPEKLPEPSIEAMVEVQEARIWDVPTTETPVVESPIEEYILDTVEEEPEEIVEAPVQPIIAPVDYPKPLETSPNAFLFQTNIHSLPTLTATEVNKTELNERLAKEETELNSILNENKIEVSHLHENTHIKDLKRAISINEKYLFINNLFGRNEELYDKTIKHIQNFSILPEATFWIQKELKTKLKWSEEDEVVQLFDQFVKRRFS